MITSLRRWIRVVGTLIVFAPDVLPAQDPSIVAPGAKLERLFDEGFFTEGPAQAPDGSVYFSDITVGKASGYQAGHIWRWDPRTRTTAVFRSPSGMSNGMVFDGQGRLVVAEGAAFGGRRITRTDMRTGKSVILAALFDGRPLNSPNDLVLDARGRIYFTDPRYVGWEPIEQPVQGVYRIDLDGRVSLIVADAGKPNGIAVSPDQATLYVGANDNGSLGDLPAEMRAAPGRKALLAYDLARTARRSSAAPWWISLRPGPMGSAWTGTATSIARFRGSARASMSTLRPGGSWPTSRRPRAPRT